MLAAAEGILGRTLELSVVQNQLFVDWRTAVAAAEEQSHWMVHMPRWA